MKLLLVGVSQASILRCFSLVKRFQINLMEGKGSASTEVRIFETLFN